MKYLILILAVVMMAAPADAKKRHKHHRHHVERIVAPETCPLSALELQDIGELEELPRSCYGEFAEPPEYDVVMFKCVNRLVVDVHGTQNSENINQNIFKEGRACVFTFEILLGEGFSLLEGTTGRPFIFQRRVLVVDKIEPAVFRWQLVN